ncbi:DUF1513 domain-containing protein [Gemmobacter fulvus]|uniref:DUF1513 domain-containing protein n=1 Tax=Gemmobacter fulvus TaxID=2840474 RepID=A0A975P5W1_9RHOB|nr:DUF1513 domain-containing protein [Gemmobacter fulvus]MBT9247539.1 DUF1513 domain-containing protein [Gemmobacter fulvus]QWK89952.1 DUF1513 domain-containing protein [Gemmobacter fulvus]
MQRRAFLASLIAATATPRLTWADAGSPAFLAAAKTHAGAYVLQGLSADGETLFALPLPARGHAATAHPTRPHAVAFARRPGTFALVIDCATGTEQARLTPPAGRQFNGHGCFSADGSVLYTSEVVAETSEGRIGLWDSASYTRLAEWPSGGIGPHDIKRLPLSEDLIIANGGIATDPADRRKLNLDTMRPNLTRLTAEGVIADQAELPGALAQNSIRHLALLPDGTVAFAMQWEGDPADPVPLLGLWSGGVPRLCPRDDADAFVMQGYAGSIAYTPVIDDIAITSPRGGAVQVFARDGSPRATLRRADACGIAAGPGGFVLTDGNGVISQVTAEGLTPARRTELSWDNHLIALA